MKTIISAKKMNIPQAFDDYATQRIESRLSKFFGDDADAKLIISEVKNQIVIELTVRYNNIIYRSEKSAVNKNDALDAAIDKIIRQIRKNKTRVEKKLRDTAFLDTYSDEIEEQYDFEVVKHKKFSMRPMELDEAILQMNLLGHNFFMFSNAKSGETNVVYKRSDGNYAVLEPVIE
ncbi:MAG: ribosome-associated translation inhibitor RaiA [Oscillospiraceae bacterium]|nr:ribosome-associated translation inhibitor RaiA [Ruminococcus sp.]MBP1565103.1 ribosome-associated translation inhibitor RaiA [Oscillospiraceae bacterium]MBQ9981866.1 ribosome-associated translation inhibitor RaiA [Oscillospiraceae bacterium]MBR6599584.1 ribosome-associated translation inhibitor RaiA [Oscillospiraceae bacterium]